MEKQLQSGTGTIYYTVKGRGPVVLLLHGFLEDHSIWNDFSDQLQNKYTCICIDLPGFGNSDVFAESHPMDFMAGKVNEVLENEKIEKCVLVGHSMGGYVSLAFAKLFPENLRGLVLFHSQAASDNEESKKNRDRTIKIVQQNHTAFIHSFIPSLFAEDHVADFSNEIDALKKIGDKTPAKGIIAALRGMRDRESQLDTLEKLEAPVYFIIGKQDSRIPMETILPQLQLPSNSEALIMDHVGHMGFIEAKEKTFLSLEHFLERNLF
ncbi:MAG: alpha/beta hydrolase [Bacteroidetes bacterium]|nr:alpha/beta hydrolase [Bacteroidota bacterium]